ncbi:peroxisomal membrane anchor protein conserved region-domain-containing protein [Globomyces pollinis-pini]|nr:peroxisomal membrane anchor protein conserved region-domain-containing protein [Globomyces pollinis-pini]
MSSVTEEKLSTGDVTNMNQSGNSTVNTIGNQDQTSSKPNTLVEIENKKEQVKSPIREDQIQIAVQFLTKVISAPKDKKIEFLKSKGLSMEEINIAFSRVSNTNVTSTQNAVQNVVNPPVNTQPPLPSRPSTIVPNYTQPIHEQPIQKSYLMSKYIIGLIMISVGGGVVFMIKKWQEWVVNVYRPFVKLYKEHLQIRLTLMQNHLMDNLPYFNLFKKISDCEETDLSILKSFKQMVYNNSKNLSKTQIIIQDIQKSEGLDLNSVNESVKELARDVRQAVYYPSEGRSASQKDVQAIKSEIRSLKGILLSRRNFPTTSVSG